jgi:hypothetical protein
MGEQGGLSELFSHKQPDAETRLSGSDLLKAAGGVKLLGMSSASLLRARYQQLLAAVDFGLTLHSKWRDNCPRPVAASSASGDRAVGLPSRNNSQRC